MCIHTHFYSILFNSPAASPTVKGRTNLKIKEKYLSPAGSSSKGLTVSRSNSSLSLYSSASAPTSPMTRKVRQKLYAVTNGGKPPPTVSRCYMWYFNQDHTSLETFLHTRFHFIFIFCHYPLFS